MKRIFLMITVLITIISCNQAHKKVTADDLVVAEWRGGRITLSEYEEFALRGEFRNDPVRAYQSTPQTRKDILNFMINNRLIMQIADSLKLDTLQTIKETRERRLQRVAYNSTLFVDSVQNKIATEEKISDFYNLIKFRYNISHILLQDPNEAEDIYRRIQDNPNDFQDLAMRYSKDTNSSVNGGYIGWNTLNVFVPEFRDKILSVNKGDITRPFRTQFGWHIAKLNDVAENSGLGDLESNRNNIRQHILSQNKDLFDSLNIEFESWVMNKYNVHIDNQNVSEFVSYYKTLMEKNVKSAINEANYNTGIVLSAFEKDTVYVKNALEAIAKSIEASLALNYELPNITEKEIYRLIFYNHVFAIRPLIIEDLGYSKRPEVLDAVNRGMISDYKEYLIENYTGTKDQENKWLSPFKSEYSLVINHLIFEKAFSTPPDIRK